MTDLGRLLASSIENHAHRPALYLAGRSISYQTLDQSARLIARKLEGATVAILAGASLGTYAGVLAAARAGRTYVPLNAELSDERLLKHITLAGVTTLIVDPERRDQACRLLKRVPTPLKVVVPEFEAAADPWPDLSPHRLVPISKASAAPPDDIGIQTNPQTPLYITFTSGTTGEPKGIPIPRRNVEAYLDSIHRLFDFRPEDRFSHFFRLSFDLSVHDMFVAWSVGACLYVPEPTDLLDPVAFARRHALTVWFSVPSLASLAIMSRKLRPDVLPALRRVLFCGEALSWGVVEAFQAAAPNAAVTNLYGPTETTIAISHYAVPKGRHGPADRRASVPIGRPFPGHKTAIVGPDLRPVPPDEPGELLLAGPQLALGYLDNPEQTTKSFLNLRLAGHDSGRWYRTGDLAKWASTGLVFLGRNDTQVKFRGHRIELGEIEAVLQQVAESPLAIVIAAPVFDGGPVKQLVAFVLPPHPPLRDMQTTLRERLPSYMVPTRIVTIDAPPAVILNDNQKIDRKKVVSMFRSELFGQGPWPTS